MKTILFIALVLAMAAAQSEFFGTCNCDSGKYYDKATGTCVAPPTPTVENCEDSKYDNGKYDATKCSQCKHNFWFESETSCKAIETADQIANCTKQTNKTTCNRCDSNYSNYDSQKKCGQLPANCESLDYQNTAVVCTYCVNKYKLNGTTCESVATNDVSNCARWSEKAKCQGCSENFYRENETTCTAQVTVANCKALYSSDKGCDECEWGYSKTDDNLKCEKGAIVDCDVHNSRDKAKCSSCKQGYQLNAGSTTCTAFTTKPTDFDSNCQTYDSSSKCTHCTYSYKWDAKDKDYEVYPKYGYTDAVKSCSKKCPSSGSNASILSFVLASLAMLALLF